MAFQDDHIKTIRDVPIAARRAGILFEYNRVYAGTLGIRTTTTIRIRTITN